MGDFYLDKTVTIYILYKFCYLHINHKVIFDYLFKSSYMPV